MQNAEIDELFTKTQRITSRVRFCEKLTNVSSHYITPDNVSEYCHHLTCCLQAFLVVLLFDCF